MSKIDLTDEELWKLKTLADFMFVDEYQNKCSSEEFEKCFDKFFQEEDICLKTVFKNISGPNKKYITFPRLIKAYLTYKNTPENLTEDCQTYFKKLAEEIVKDKEDQVGDEKIQAKIYTSANCKNKAFISGITIYQDDETQAIKGIKFEYDDSFKAYLYDRKNKKLNTKTECELEELTADPEVLEKVTIETEFIFRDSITHVYGTYSDKIEFLGFMLRSGKEISCGTPTGKPFLFGQPGLQLHYLRMKVSNDGIIYFQPHFKETPRLNEFINKKMDEITQDYLDNEEVISDEVGYVDTEEPVTNLRAGKAKKEDDEIVFKEKADPLDSKGKVNQYYLETDDGYLIGLENNSNFDYTLNLKTSGLTIQTPKIYKGKTNIPSFNLPKNSKMAFRTTTIPDNDDEIYFLFESL